MDSARQVLRFSIPGSVLLLHGLICYLLYQRFQGVAFIDASALIRTNVTALIAVVATIPTGFVVYQLYYFRYVPVLKIWLRPWGGRFVRMDRGGQILRTLDSAQLRQLEDIFQCQIDREQIHKIVPKEGSPFERLMYAMGVLEVDGKTKALEMKERQSAYEKRWYTHWDVLRSAIDISALTIKELKADYTSLSDIYHSLGAARTAVTTAWAGVCLIAISHAVRGLDSIHGVLIGVFLISALTSALWFVLHVARGRTWRTASASLQLGLRWLHWQDGRPPPEIAKPDVPVG